MNPARGSRASEQFHLELPTHDPEQERKRGLKFGVDVLNIVQYVNIVSYGNITGYGAAREA